MSITETGTPTEPGEVEELREKVAFLERTLIGWRDHANDQQERAEKYEAAVRRVQACTFEMDDGTEYEHNDGCGGEPTCPACWVENIRLAVQIP